MDDAVRTAWGRRLITRLRPRPSDRQGDAPLRALEIRVTHVEAALQGLQDATHRLFVQQNERMDELSKRTQPEELARALSQDARDRGL